MQPCGSRSRSPRGLNGRGRGLRLLAAALVAIAFVVANAGAALADSPVTIDIRDASSESDYWVVLFARESLTGHAYVGLYRSDPEQQMTSGDVFGMYPDDRRQGLPSLVGPVPGGLVDEIASGRLTEPAEQLIVRVGARHHRAVQEVRAAWEQRKYRLLDTDCVTFLAEVAVALGLDVPPRNEAIRPVTFVREIIERATTLVVALCLDRSGSMQGPKLQAAKDAARGLVTTLRVREKAALISFDARASLDVPMTKFESPVLGLLTGFPERKPLLDAIERLQADGRTNFEAPLREALAVLAPEWSPARIVVLLSDGQAGSPTAEIDALARLGIPVYAIAFGGDADIDRLDEIARGTGGIAYPAGVGNLKQVFMQIGGRARGESDALVARGLLYPGESRTWTYSVPAGSTYLNNTVQWPGSDISLTLRSPTGMLITEQTAATLDGVAYMFDPVSHTRSITVAPAEAGTWEVEIVGVDVAADGEMFAVTSSYASDAPVAVMPFLPEYAVNDEVRLALNVLAGATAATTVTASIGMPDGTRRAVALRDDGSSGDVTAGDGIYSTLFQDTHEPGFCEATFTVSRDGQSTQTVISVFRIGTDEELRELDRVDPDAPEDFSGGYVVTTAVTGEPDPVITVTDDDEDDDDAEDGWGWSIAVLLLACAGVLASIVIARSRAGGSGTALAVLLVDTGTGIPQRVEVRAAVFSIGRDTGNSLPIGDPGASRLHAELRREPDGQWVVADLGSANGTAVNGKPVTRHRLSAGDVIRIGETTLELLPV